MRVGGSDLPPFESRGITPIELEYLLTREEFSLETIHLSLINSIYSSLFSMLFHFNRLKCISVILVAKLNNFFI
jgi:hypothetical protein